MERATGPDENPTKMTAQPGTGDFDKIARVISLTTGTSSDFDLNPDVKAPPATKLRPAAVLIPLVETSAGVQVILTKRASGLKHHPGQISFPGGAIDATDLDPVAAALREAWEEIRLPVANNDVLGVLPSHHTVTAFHITPVLSRIRGSFDPIPEPGEVAEVFRVPLSHLMDISRFQIESRIWQGNRRFYYVVPYGPYYIWGATARILRSLAEGWER